MTKNLIEASSSSDCTIGYGGFEECRPRIVQFISILDLANATRCACWEFEGFSSEFRYEFAHRLTHLYPQLQRQIGRAIVL